MRTHCRNGHEYTEENSYWYDGHRWCRRCRTISQARYQKTAKGRAVKRRYVRSVKGALADVRHIAKQRGNR